MGLSQNRDRLLHPIQWPSAIAYSSPSSQLSQCPGITSRSRNIHWAIPQDPCALKERNKVLEPLYLGLHSQEEEAPCLLLRHPFCPITYTVPSLDLRKDLVKDRVLPLLLMPTELTVTTRTDLRSGSLTEVG